MFSCHIAAVFRRKKNSTRPTVHYHLPKEPDIFLRIGGDQNRASSGVNVENCWVAKKTQMATKSS